VTWQGWGTNGRVWLTFNGAIRTTVVLTDSEATELNRPGSVKALMSPGLSGVGLLDDHSSPQIGRPVHMPKSYPPEFRRKVLDLVASGRRVTQVTADLDISEQCIHSWRRQGPFDSGQIDGVASADQAEMVVVRRRIAELEPEVEIRRRAVQLLQTFGPSPLGQLIL
jgi:transposase